MDTDHRYNIEITENDPRAEQPKKIKTILKPHQLASLYKAQQLEKAGVIKYDVPNPEEFMRPGHGRNIMYRGKFTVRTDMGLMGDIVGYGKTLTALGLVASVPTDQIHKLDKKTYSHYGHKSRAYIEIDCELPEDTDERKLFGTTVIIVPRGPVYSQWEQCMKNSTTLKYLAIDDLRVIKKKCPPTGATNAELKEFFEGYDVILIKNTSISKLIDHYDVPFRTNPIRGFDRIMIDEAHDIISKIPILDYSFLWMITATSTIITTWGSSSYILGMVRDMLNEERKNTILVKCENNFTKKSFEVPAYHEIIYNCHMPTQVTIAQPFLSRNVMDLVNANDIAGAVRELGGNVDTEDNILSALTSNIQRDINNRKKEKDYVNTLDITNDAKENRLRTITADIERLEQRKANLEERIRTMTDNTCPICFDTMENPIILACTHGFCGSCIMGWMEASEKTGVGAAGGFHRCPTCREVIRDKNSLTAIVKKTDDKAGPSNEKKQRKELSKLETIVKIIKKKPNGKFLIFSQYDVSFNDVAVELHKIGVTTSELKGNTHQMAKILERFNNGELRVILLNAFYTGSGIDISNATDVILFHSMGSYNEQAIGRAQRVGRTEQLTVHRLCYPHEINQ